MKKLTGITMFIILIGLMSACDSVENEKSDYISEADLDEREETILTTVADQSFVFDFHNTAYEEVSVWIEKYESGELVNDELGYMTTEIDDEGSSGTWGQAHCPKWDSVPVPTSHQSLDG